MLKHLLLIALSSAFALILAAGLGEVVLEYRYNAWRSGFDLSGDSQKIGLPVASTNAKLLWEYRPYTSYIQPRFRTETKTNRFGFRQSDDVKLSRLDGVARVAFVGDSVTLGREVSFEATFPEAFAREEASNGTAVEALNFGIDGYSTPQVAELFATRVVDFTPDIVVYSICLNDFDFEEASGAKVRYFSPPDSFFLDALKKIYRLAVVDDYYRYFFDLNKEIVFAEIERMRRDAERIGAEFHVAIMPVFDFEGTSFETYEPMAIHRGIVEKLEAEGIEVLDLVPEFARTGLDPKDLAQDNWHLNAQGHAVVGDALVRYFQRNSALRTKSGDR